MKRIGCALAICGVLLLVGSISLLGVSIKKAVDSKKVAEIPLEVGQEITTEVVAVDTSQLCQLTLDAIISSESVEEKDQPGFDKDEPEFELRYDFPFHYTVLDEDDNKVMSERDHLRWEGTGVGWSSGGDVNADGGTINAGQSYEKFEVSPPGRIKIRIEVEPDTTYDAQAKEITLTVYDHVSTQGTAVGGATMLCVAPIVIALGIVIFVVGLFTPSKPAEPHPSDF